MNILMQSIVVYVTINELIENGSGWKFREGVADPMLFSLKMLQMKWRNQSYKILCQSFFLHATL